MDFFKKFLFFAIGICLSACGSTSRVSADCHYKLGDQEIFDRFQSYFPEVNMKEIGIFDIKRKNCNYYIKYIFHKKTVDSSVIIYIFDKEGEMVTALSQ